MISSLWREKRVGGVGPMVDGHLEVSAYLHLVAVAMRVHESASAIALGEYAAGATRALINSAHEEQEKGTAKSGSLI